MLDEASRNQLRREIIHHYDIEYVEKAVPARSNFAFSRIFEDTFALDLGHPWFETLERLKGQTLVPPTHLNVRGLPAYLWAELSLRQQNLIIRRTQECQVHFTRLNSLRDAGSPFLASAAVDLRQSAYSACTGDYNAARWSALHATEKILKAVIQAFEQKYKKTHVLHKLVEQVERLTGLRITPSRFDGLLNPTQLRYSEGSSYKQAERTFMQALRIISFLYPVLRAKNGLKATDWASFFSPEERTRLDKMVLLSNYPGFFCTTYWQKPFTGLYGEPILLKFAQPLASDS